MQFAIASIILGFAAIASAGVAGDASIFARQNAGRPVPSGNCCVAATSVKQDTCTATNGQTGKCVPGGAGACNGALNCVADSGLTCDASIIERGKPLCRAKVANGLQDGAKVITSLSQAKVN
ncbi:hypothetical protein GLAREA_06761 [Glarea lozoyensis ATCC 20868]|uniref:Uncharacterized protein n=1 Tax=Glarea lozoyensis (strain ATCC 20868 / MF5171) TaxID=1116229 RepID=S3E5V3_GLAL2|nr:uncharacterized protein GLAREA_06761 [Glarea lozoyensis ATCC 20868]EPE33748.1 hypothetical protein GLAREA_06761 [Glarea lozoyensis ATCC 20868]